METSEIIAIAVIVGLVALAPLTFSLYLTRVEHRQEAEARESAGPPAST